MNTTFNDARLVPFDFPETTTQTATQTHHEPPFEFTLAGAGAAILLWLVLFAGFLFSWFTMGQV